MPKLTIDLDNYSKADQELIQAIWRKFKPMDKKKDSHICDALPYFMKQHDWSACPGCRQEFDAAVNKYNASVDAENATTENPIWKPEQQEYFWIIYPDGSIGKEHDAEDPWGSCLFNRGNVFKTEEAAQRMADRRKRIGIFENKMMEFANGYEFINDGQNWYISYLVSSWEYQRSLCSNVPTTIYMTKENAEKAVEWANKHYPVGL